MKRLLLLLLPLIVMCADSHAAGPIIDVLNVPGIIINSYFVDLDNDHKCEAILFYIDETGTRPMRKAALFTLNNGHYSEMPSQIFEIAPTAECFDFGDLNGDGYQELGLITKDGVIGYQYINGAIIMMAEPIIKNNNALNAQVYENIVHWDFVKDIDSPHKDALIFLPIESGLELYKWNGKKYLPAQSLNYNYRTSVRSISAYENYRPMGFLYSCGLPAITIADYNGDKLADLFISDNRMVNIHKHNYDGSYTVEPAEIFGKDIQNEQERHSPQAAISFDICDLNNDGLADFVVTKNAWDISSYNTVIQIFRGKQMGGYNNKPNNEFAMANGASSPHICDLNQDGKLDLLLPSLKLGIMSNLKILILKSVEVNLMGFIQQGTDNYSDKPDYEKSLSYEVSPSQNIDYSSILTLDGDYNGDGRKDLLVHDGSGELKIYLGSNTKIFENTTNLEFSISRPDGINAMDLNGDGKSEIIAYYQVDFESRKTLRIIWPRL